MTMQRVELMATDADHKKSLVHVLQMAYSGERAAALAYNAHWKSLTNKDQIARIKQIEQEELDHRRIVGQMLIQLSAAPQGFREVMMTVIGCTVGCACFIIGWFLPMYFAGRLESGNIKEYEHAAGHAAALGLNDMHDKLMRLSVVEAQHEEYFRTVIEGHWLLPTMHNVFGWGFTAPNLVKVENKVE